MGTVKAQTLSRELLNQRLAVSVPEAAALLGVSAQTVARMIAAGRLEARNVASGRERKCYVIPVEALKAWISGGGNGR